MHQRPDSDQSFAAAIGLSRNWPKPQKNLDNIALTGDLKWADAYVRGAETLIASDPDRSDLPFFLGPLIHVVGIANELVLKCILKGGGLDADKVRGYGHNTYKAYLKARDWFDEARFINLIFSNTSHLTIPPEIAERLSVRSEPDPDHYWRFYPNHLRILDTTYNKPYRTRYVSHGPLVAPEPYILLVGARILLAAMSERSEESEQLVPK